MNEREKKAGTIPAATASAERKEVSVVRMLAGGTRQVRNTFNFDEVLTSFSTQDEVFQATLEPLVSQVLAGFETTAFAYGQTGTGKTHTMEGDLACEEDRGLVPRAAAAVLDRLSSGEFTEHSITVSYLEIYNEELSDLLVPALQQSKLDLKDTGGGRGVSCIGLAEVPVCTLEQILELIGKAQERRRIAETRLNARSSRSHCIFTLKVRCRKRVSVGEFENTGKLHLVDLAGSECAKKAGTPSDEHAGSVQARSGQNGAAEEERERRSINQSLLTLGRVIASLRDGSGRVPYRDSKLTRLLQDALGGKSKTVIIATLSPAMNAVEETISTLTYAEQASGIRNRPVASSLLRTHRTLVTDSRDTSGGASNSGCGATDWAELELKVAYLTQEVEEAQAALARKYQETQRIEENLKNSRTELRGAKVALEEKSFVHDRFVSYADHQSAVAAGFMSAFDAAYAHGHKLDSLLSAMAKSCASVRSQVREVCSSGQEKASKEAESSISASKEVVKVALTAHAAHAEASELAITTTSAQMQDVEELAACVSHTCDGWDNLMKAAADHSSETLSCIQAASEDALHKIEAAASGISSLASTSSSDTRTAAKHGKDSMTQQVDTLHVDLNSGQEMIGAMAGKLMEELSSACDTAKSSGEAALKKLSETVQDPIALLQDALEEDEAFAQKHVERTEGVRQCGLANAKEASAQRDTLSKALATISDEHCQSIAARPAALKEEIQSLKTCLQSRGQAAEECLSSGRDRLESSRSTLAEATVTGKDSVLDALSQADAQLCATWTEQRKRIEKIGMELAEAAKKQCDGNAAEAMQTITSKAMAALNESLASSLSSLASVRAAIAIEVSELQEQRSSEQQIVSLLTEQRENLQTEVEVVRAELHQATASLTASRSEISDLKSRQAQGHAQALEKIMSLVKNEFANLGEDVERGSTTACKYLEDSCASIRAGEEAVVVAQGHCSESGGKVVEAASLWSHQIDTRCSAIGVAQEKFAEAARCMQEAGTLAGSEFQKLNSLSEVWGSNCDGVATSLAGTVVGNSELGELQASLQPMWANARECGMQATTTWAGACGEVGCGLDEVGSSLVVVAQECGSLSIESGNHLGCVNDRIDLWNDDGESVAASLRRHADHVDEVAKLEDQANSKRAKYVDELHEQAIDACGRLGKSKADANVLMQSVIALGATIPSDVQTCANAFGTASSSVEKISEKASLLSQNAAESVSTVYKVQSGAVERICESVNSANQAMADHAASCISVDQSLKNLLHKSTQELRDRWQQLDSDSRSQSTAIRDKVNTSKEAALTAGRTFTKNMADTLHRGEAAHKQSTAAFEEVVSAAVASLMEQANLAKAGFSKEPLLAFEEDMALAREAIPAWPSEACQPSKRDLMQRPDEECLRAEFRETKSTSDDAENQGTPTAKLKAQVSPMSESGSRNGGEHASGREILKELNP
jgi:kinesin family protein 11